MWIGLLSVFAGQAAAQTRTTNTIGDKNLGEVTNFLPAKDREGHAHTLFMDVLFGF